MRSIATKHHISLLGGAVAELHLDPTAGFDDILYLGSCFDEVLVWQPIIQDSKELPPLKGKYIMSVAFNALA